MKQDNFDFWQKWLTYANVLAVVIGLLVAFFGNSLLFSLHNMYSAQVFFGEESFAPDVFLFKNWLFGIIGGTIVGFHILMIFICEYAFKNKEKWSYYAMLLGLVSWFFIDSSISLVYLAIHNVLLINIPAFIMIGLPLIFTYKYFEK